MLISKAAYARRHNFTPAYVSKLIKQKRILVKDGKVDAEISDRMLGKAQAQTEAAAHAAADPNTPAIEANIDFNEARARLTDNKAKLTALQLEKESGKTIDAIEVEASAFTVARITRDAILAIPDRISAQLAAEDDINKIREMLLAELREALEELSTQIKG